MKYFIQGDSHSSRGHVALEETAFTATPTTLCGLVLSPKRWNIVERPPERFFWLCLRCRGLLGKQGRDSR